MLCTRNPQQYHYIQANELRSFAVCGRPRVGVGGLCTFNSYNVKRSKALFFNSLREVFRGILPASTFPHQAHHQMILETPLEEVDG